MESSSGSVMIVGTLLVGVVSLLLGYVVTRSSKKNNAVSKKVAMVQQNMPKAVLSQPQQCVMSNKRAKNKKRREAQQDFVHSWSSGSLKGHTAPVLDIALSSNGKYLASCAEGKQMIQAVEPIYSSNRRDTRSRSDYSSSSTSSDDGSSSGSGNSFKGSPSGRPNNGDRAILSRRQRKNRTRAPRDQKRDGVPQIKIQQDQHHQHRQHTNQHQLLNQQHGRCEPMPVFVDDFEGFRDSVPLNLLMNKPWAMLYEQNNALMKSGDGQLNDNTVDERSKLWGYNNVMLFKLMNCFILSRQNLFDLGYPVAHWNKSLSSTHAIINYTPYPKTLRRVEAPPALDANAAEFVPKQQKSESESDSGVCSTDGSSHGSDDEIVDGYDNFSKKGNYNCQSRKTSEIADRTCIRCKNKYKFRVKNNDYVNIESCHYHQGKFRESKYCKSTGKSLYFWDCCYKDETAPGCQSAKQHVWNGFKSGFNGPLPGFVFTKSAPSRTLDGYYGIYGLDCEMVYTKNGLEVAKVTVVSVDGELRYESLVLPSCEVVDYNTRFSGITEEMLNGITTTLEDVQKKLCSFIHAESILVGHGLENDLRVLKIVHSRVIDTSIVFPHSLGMPLKFSLKQLSKVLLDRDIQDGAHDSAIDAKTAMDLMLRRILMLDPEEIHFITVRCGIRLYH